VPPCIDSTTLTWTVCSVQRAHEMIVNFSLWAFHHYTDSVTYFTHSHTHMLDTMCLQASTRLLWHKLCVRHNVHMGWILTRHCKPSVTTRTSLLTLPIHTYMLDTMHLHASTQLLWHGLYVCHRMHMGWLLTRHCKAFHQYADSATLPELGRHLKWGLHYQ
jgi:hypothetical protein